MIGNLVRKAATFGTYDKNQEAWPHVMCYSHFGNDVHNGVMQQGFINDRYKVNPVGQWGKILVMVMGFVDHLGHRLHIGTVHVN